MKATSFKDCCSSSFLIRASMILAMFTVACQKQQVSITVNVHAVDHEGSPLENALVTVNGKQLGSTDEKGSMRRVIAVTPPDRIKVKVSKDNHAHFYFGPYQEVVPFSQITQGGINLKAKLYFVPKYDEVDSSKFKTNLSTLDAGPAQLIQNEDTSVPVLPIEPSPVTENTDAKLASTVATPVDVTQDLLTVHVFAASKPLSGVEVFWSLPGQDVLERGCESNERGRCVIAFNNVSTKRITLMVRKKGYQTVFEEHDDLAGKSLTFQMKHGETMDFKVVTKDYGRERGLRNLQVAINGVKIGTTNRFGIFSYVLQSFDLTALNVAIHTEGFLPELIDLDLDQSKDRLLTRMVRSKVAVVPNVFFAAPKVISYRPGFADMRALIDDQGLQRVRTKLNEQFLFRLVDDQQHSDFRIHLESHLDQQLVHVLTLRDSQDQVIASVEEHATGEHTRLEQLAAIERAAVKLSALVPYEGTIVAKDNGSLTLNLGKKHDKSLQKGSVVAIRTKGELSVAANITEVWDESAQISVLRQEQMPKIDLGDLAILHDPKPQESKQTLQMTISNQAGESVANARIYQDGVFVGSTDSSGKVLTYRSDQTPMQLVVLAQDFVPYFRKDIHTKEMRTLDVVVAKRTQTIRFETDPTGAAVTLNGVLKAKTPTEIALNEIVLPLQIHIEGPQHLKPVDITITTENKDVYAGTVQKLKLYVDSRRAAQQLIEAKKYQEAIALLNKVEKSNPEYLMAYHDLGEIYLQHLNDPEQAGNIFREMVKSDVLAKFSDKRLLSAYINLGISDFLAAERLVQDKPARAAELYQNAFLSLSKINDQVEMIPDRARAKAQLQINYYLALSKQKLWAINKQPGDLEIAKVAWQHYIDLASKSSPQITATIASYVDNAKTYLRHAESEGTQQPIDLPASPTQIR